VPGLAVLKTALGGIDRLSLVVVVIVMGLMVTIVSVQVLLRYALDSSLDSADELSRLFFVWAMFLAIPHGIKIGIHVGIDLFVNSFRPGLQAVIFRMMSAAGAFLMLLVFFVGLDATADKWPELMPTLPVSAGLYYVAVVVSAAHSFLHLVVLTIGGSRTWEDAPA
jgi:TRAP-type C4-dicarboxylate transport system permease small subunit